MVKTWKASLEAEFSVYFCATCAGFAPEGSKAGHPYFLTASHQKSRCRDAPRGPELLKESRERKMKKKSLNPVEFEPTAYKSGVMCFTYPCVTTATQDTYFTSKQTRILRRSAFFPLDLRSPLRIGELESKFWTHRTYYSFRWTLGWFISNLIV